MLLPHNIPVYEKFEAMLQEEGKVILVTATGTGKSYVTEEYIRNHDLKALVVCPKKSINRQWESMTDRVQTMTYQKLSKQTDLSVFDDYDCFIFDEAHHCGSPVWGAAARRLMEETDKPVIGLTADSRRFSDGGKDVAEEIWDNCVVFGYDQAEAIERGILPAATYVCTLFDSRKLEEEIKSRARGSAISPVLLGRLALSAKNCGTIKEVLLRHNPEGKRKGIVFTDRIESTSEAFSLIRDIYPYTNVLVAHSKMPQSEVDAVAEAFEWLDEGYLIVVDMLNEGLHIKGVNTIIMLRRTASPTIFMQQCGRALATGNEDIVIFDFVGNNRSLKVIAGRVSEALQLGSVIKQEGKRSGQIIIHDYASEFLSVVEKIKAELDSKWTEEEDNIIREFYPEEGSCVADRLPDRTRSACQRRAQILGINFLSVPNPWTAEEDAILREFYPTEGFAVVERLPGRTKKACQYRAADALGLSVISDEWTAEEDDIIRQFYPVEGPAVAERLPNRTSKACQARATRLGVYFITRKWTAEEDDILRKFFPTEGTDVAKRLPGKTQSACGGRAHKLGLKKDLPKDGWTPEEDEIMRTFYPSEGLAVAARLPRRSESACQNRAKKLSLKADKAWSEEEDAIIREFYPKEGSAVSGRLPGKTKDACKRRARSLGIAAPNYDWTAEEDAIIREFYPKEGIKAAYRLPNRTKAAFGGRAAALGVKAPTQDWTSKEDDILKAYYEIEGNSVPNRLPGRSPSACEQRARKIGVNIKSDVFWTDAEDDIIREFYASEGAAVAARLQDRTPSACSQRARILGVKAPQNKWTEEEDSIIREFFPTEGKEVAVRLPGRTEIACQGRARVLDIKQTALPNASWTEEEDNIIREFYPLEGKRVADRLNSRTTASCQRRAAQLGVSKKKREGESGS